MALIKCSECKKDVSTLAETCPHCGAPVNKENKESKNQIGELQKVLVLKEKCKFITFLLPLLVSFAMLIAFVLFDIDNYYLLVLREQEYNLIRCISNKIFLYETLIIYGLIGFITLLSYIFMISSKKTAIVAKVGYIINIVLQIIYFNLAFDNDFRIGNQYYIIFALNILLFLIPRFDKVVSEEMLIPKHQQEKIEKRNSKLEKLYTKKRFTIFNVVSVVVVLLISLLSLALIYNKNFETIEAYEQKNPHNLTQLKVKIDYITVREEPSYTSDSLGRVYRGDIYNIQNIIDEDKKYIWYEIKYDGDTAYIASERDNPYVKIIYNDDEDYEVPEDYGLPNSPVEKKLQKTLSKQGYVHSDNSRYTHNYTQDGTEIITYLNLDENTFSRRSELEDYTSLATYYFLEDKVTYKFVYSKDYYGEFTYNIETKKVTCDSNVPNYCSSNVYSDIENFSIPITDAFKDLLEDSDLEFSDF